VALVDLPVPLHLFRQNTSRGRTVGPFRRIELLARVRNLLRRKKVRNRNEHGKSNPKLEIAEPRFSCPLSSLDTRALPVSILCGDPKFPPSQHAGAIPPGSLSVPAQEHFGFYALPVVPVSECVFAGC
jgi:hypothetical protein